MLVLFLKNTNYQKRIPKGILNDFNMLKEEKYKKLKDIVKIYLPEDVAVKDIEQNSHFMNDLNINSANLVDIVLDVEDAFDIRLENEDMEKMQTVNDAMAIIDAKLAQD
ncbi:phosphopantetheine-binding protein [Maribacter sp.]|uniref:phosphopantetheine-binding protein n=2 Tax=Maribacter TaxID=252356 RepID=UPI00344187FE